MHVYLFFVGVVRSERLMSVRPFHRRSVTSGVAWKTGSGWDVWFSFVDDQVDWDFALEAGYIALAEVVAQFVYLEIHKVSAV